MLLCQAVASRDGNQFSCSLLRRMHRILTFELNELLVLLKNFFRECDGWHLNCLLDRLRVLDLI